MPCAAGCVLCAECHVLFAALSDLADRMAEIIPSNSFSDRYPSPSWERGQRRWGGEGGGSREGHAVGAGRVASSRWCRARSAIVWQAQPKRWHVGTAGRAPYPETHLIEDPEYIKCSLLACPRAGWISMLLLEWLTKQCNHPAQGLAENASVCGGQVERDQSDQKFPACVQPLLQCHGDIACRGGPGKVGGWGDGRAAGNGAGRAGRP